MIAVDINSDEVVGLKVLGLPLYTQRRKTSGKANSAIVCSHCNKPGHNDKECYTNTLILTLARRNPKGKDDKGKDGIKG